MVADLILVDREYAGLVDAVLGDQVQALLVRDWDALRPAVCELGDALPAASPSYPRRSWPGTLPNPCQDSNLYPTLVGSLQAEWAALSEHLLRHTWIVDDLDQARPQWALHYPGHRFVTRPRRSARREGPHFPRPRSRGARLPLPQVRLRELRHQAREAEVTLAQKGAGDRRASACAAWPG